MRGAQCECVLNGMLRYVTLIGHTFKKYVTLRTQCESALTHQMYLACNLNRTFAYIPYGSTAYMCLHRRKFRSSCTCTQYGEYSRAQVREIRGYISRMMPMKFEVVCDEKPPLSAVYVYVRVVVCTHTHDGPQSGTLNNRKLANEVDMSSW